MHAILMKPLKLIQRQIICQVTVLGVEDEYAWYYNACSSCDEEVDFKDGKYWCEKCQTNIAVPCGRYRLCLIAEDFSSCVAIILDDREIQSIIKKNASEVFLEQEKEGKQDQFPNIFRNFEGNRYTITLCLSEGNIKHDSSMYTAIDICEVHGIEHEMFGDSTLKIEEHGIEHESSLRMLHSPDRESSTNRKRLGYNNSQTVFEVESAGDEDDENMTPVSKHLQKSSFSKTRE